MGEWEFWTGLTGFTGWGEEAGEGVGEAEGVAVAAGEAGGAGGGVESWAMAGRGRRERRMGRMKRGLRGRRASEIPEECKWKKCRCKWAPAPPG